MRQPKRVGSTILRHNTCKSLLPVRKSRQEAAHSPFPNQPLARGEKVLSNPERLG